ncbi:MAG: ABC transporter permease [Gaiellaceae bacterium]
MARLQRSYVRPAEVIVPYALVVIALVGGSFAAQGFLSTQHLSSMGQTAAYVGIIAIGQTLVLLLGGIDLSVPYMINFAAVLLAGFQFHGMSPTKDIVYVLLVGAGVGLANGVGVAFLGISPLVMTLGMNSVLQGASLLYTHGSPIGQAPAFVTTVSTGWWHQIPYVDIMWFALTVIVTLVLVFTTFGRSLYAIGSNRRASELSGLPVRRTIVVAYVLSALAATVGGLLLVGYSGQAYLGMGDEYLLPAIAVVVIGGTSIFGGKGSYVQTVAGALLITVIESALVTVNVDQAGQDILYGAIILAMAFVNQVAVSGGGARLGALGARLGPFSGWLQPVRGRAEPDARDLTSRPDNPA